MVNLTVSSWNIYFSHELVSGSSGNLSIPGSQQSRAENIASVISAIDPHVLGIIECMPLNKLWFFRDTFHPGYEAITEGNGTRLNLGMLYWPDEVGVKKVPFDKNNWQDRLFHNRPPKTYKWARIPLIVKVTHHATGKAFVVAVVHPKSKKTYSQDPVEKRKEALKNRERIVAEGRRIHSILWQLHQNHGGPFERFIILGDINDGPWFDEFEAKILRSGVESHIGSVYRPDRTLHSFVDLSDEHGRSTTPPSWGAPQLDHILFTHDFAHGTGTPRIVAGSGRIRDDLVDFNNGSGKTTDSDHCPVQVTVRVT